MDQSAVSEMTRFAYLVGIILLSHVAVCCGCKDSVVGDEPPTVIDEPPAVIDDPPEPECPGEVTVRTAIPDTSVYIGQSLVLPIDGNTWMEPFFVQSAGQFLYFDYQITSGDASLVSLSRSGERRTRLHIEGRREGVINVTASATDSCNPEVSATFSVTIVRPIFPVGEVLELTQIGPRSPSVSGHFPDSLRSGVLPHIIDGGYGHTGVLQPPRSFWIVLESGELLMSYTEFQLALQYAVFTDGQPYGDGVLGERCSWTATGTYSTDEGHVVLSLYSEAYPGTSDGQVGIVDIAELLVEGCRHWAYQGQAWKWRMKDARFTSAD